MAADGSIIIDTRINSNGMRRGVNEIESSMTRLGGVIKKIGILIAGAFAVKGLVDFGKECLRLGSDLEEVQNVVDVTFPHMTDRVNEFARSAADAFGLSETMAKKYVGTFGAMAKSFGYSEEAAYDMATALAGLTGDVASFYNISQDLAYIKLKSVFSGETETLKDLGIVMTQNALDQYALANGYGKTTAKMTEQEKVALRLRFVQEQLSAASGDFARTSDSWANQVRIMQLRLQSLKATIGQGLINLFTPVIKAINTFLAKLEVATEAFKRFTETVTGRKSGSSSTSVPPVVSGDIQETEAIAGVQDGYEGAADSAEKYGDAVEEAGKKTKKALAPFDELATLEEETTDQLQKNDLDFGDAFEPDQAESGISEVEQKIKELESAISNFAQTVKYVLTGLFNPFRESWEENGPYVVESAKYAASSLKQLAFDIGSSFMQVWNAEGYGKAITDDLLITLGNLFQTVGNLTTQFDKAWVSGETGTNILRHLGDIILEITGFFRAASESIMNWSKNIDFSPLLKSFDGILVAIRPIVNDVGSALLWLLDNVLLPLAKWGIEQALPAVFDLISVSLKVLHGIVQALRPLAIWLWESFLQPLGKWTGQVIIMALKTLSGLLDRFSKWIMDNQETVKYMTVLIASFFAAWKLKGIVDFLSKVPTLILSITNIIGSIKSFEGALYILKYALGQVNIGTIGLTAAIGGIIALISVLAMNWDKMTPGEKVVAGILAAAAAVGILAVALGAIAGGVGAAVVAASLTAGIAAATIAINAGKRQVANYQSSARSGRTAYPTSAYAAIPYRMPRLATGTVVPPRAGEFAAILGDNKREPEVVSPLSTIEQGVENALSRHNFGGGDITIKFTGSLAELARILKPELDRETSRRGTQLVIGGTGR